MKQFKNDNERKAFLEDYRNTNNGWYLWRDHPYLQRRLWRHELPGCSLVVEEEYRTFLWPEEYKDWTAIGWYLIKDWSQTDKTFADQKGSKTQALQLIKQLQKEGK